MFLIKDHFTTIFGHFLPICMLICPKTEIQTVILKCLTSLNSDWSKSYDTKCKHIHFRFCLQFCTKKTFAFFAFLCFVLWNLYWLRFRLVKHLQITVWISVLWKIHNQLLKKWPDLVVKWPFISCYFLGVCQTHTPPQATSEAIIFEPIMI